MRTVGKSLSDGETNCGDKKCGSTLEDIDFAMSLLCGTNNGQAKYKETIENIHKFYTDCTLDRKRKSENPSEDVDCNCHTACAYVHKAKEKYQKESK